MTNYQPVHQARTQQATREEPDLGRLFGVLLDHKWLIAAITALFMLAGVIYALQATPIYRADALVQIEEDSPSNPLTEMSTLMGQDPPTESEIGIIRSRMVLGRAVDILNLDLQVTPVRLPLVGELLTRLGVERPAFAVGGDPAQVMRLPYVDAGLARLGMEKPLLAVLGGYAWGSETIRLEAMPVSDAYLGKSFTLEVIDKQRYAIHYQGEHLGEGRVGTPSEFLDGEVSMTVESIEAAPGSTFELTHIRRLMAIDSLRSNLEVIEEGQGTGILSWALTGPVPELAETTLATIADIYLAQNIQRQSEEARKSLDFLNQQVPAVHEELSQAENRLNVYRTDRDSVDLSLETQSVLERLLNLETRLNELEFTEAEISRRFTPSHPTYAALLEKKAQLQSERANLESKINALPETQQEILRLQRDVSVTQEIYVQLRNKAQEMQIAEASTIGNVRVLDNAEVFPFPVQPNKALIVMAATLLGGVIAIGLVLLRAVFNRGIETADELEQLGLPVYATVPLSEEQNSLERLAKRGLRKRAMTDALLAERHPVDSAVEALRGLRTSLHFAMLGSDNNRLMITGPSPGIGKSFVAVNLAAVCAQSGQRVLLIDGDMRKGHIHSMFGAHSEGGLSDILAERYSPGEMIREVEGLDNLHYLSRGVAPPNPSELLASKRFTDLLDEVSQHYDLVIIDSPPVLAVTDAAIIGEQAGTSLIVARFQLNPAKEIELALRRLDNAGVTVKGAILNALERKAATAYGYGYYNYSYK